MTDNKSSFSQSNLDSGQNDPAGSSYEVSVIDLIKIAWQSKYIILICILFVTISGIIYALRATEKFSTSSYFITKTTNNPGGNLGQLASLAGITIGNKSNVDPSDFLDKVIEDKEFIESLYERKWYFKGDSLFLDKILEILPDTTLPNWKHVFYINKIDKIRSGNFLNLNKNRKDGILTLTSIAPDPQLTYDLNIFTIDFLSSYLRNTIKNQAKEKRQFIQNRINDVKNELANSENALIEFKERNFSNNSPEAFIEEMRLTRDITMNQEIYVQLQKQFEMARIEELNDQALIQIIKRCEVPIKRSSPNRKKIVLICMMSGFLVGLFLSLSIYLVRNIISKKEFFSNVQI